MPLITPKTIGTKQPPIYLAAIWILSVALFLPPNLMGINIFDEGFIVSGALLVKEGGLPYRDFLSMYGPGQYYLTAAIFSVLGENLLYVRFLHVFLLSALGVVIYQLAKQTTTSPNEPLLFLPGYIALILYVKPSVGYPAISSTLFVLLSVLALHGQPFHTKKLIVASCMIGIAGLFRWDFGIFGLFAIATTLVIAAMQEKRNLADVDFFRYVFAATLPAIFIMAIVYIPLIVILSDPVRWYEEVPLFSFKEFAKWRNLEFVQPAYQGLFSTSVMTVARSIFDLFYIGFPVIMVIGALGTVAYAFKHRPTNTENNNLFIIVFLALLCLCLLNQMRIRPTLWQGFPALITSLPLALLLVNYHRDLLKKALILIPVSISIKIMIGIIFIYIGVQSLRIAMNDYLVPFDTPRTSRVLIDSGMKSYIDLVKYVQVNTKRNEPIFSGVQDHSRLYVNDALLYFLTDRPPADRFLELEPGIANTQHGQEEIIQALQGKKVRVIVLISLLSNEPNLTSRSNGVTILDEYIRANYRFDKKFADRMVFIKN